jgi:hypothetical protein
VILSLLAGAAPEGHLNSYNQHIQFHLYGPCTLHPCLHPVCVYVSVCACMCACLLAYHSIASCRSICVFMVKQRTGCFNSLAGKINGLPYTGKLKETGLLAN